MQRTERIAKAAETLRILESGHYTYGGRDVSIAAMLDDSLKRTVHYREGDFAPVLAARPQAVRERSRDTIIRVENCTVLAGAEQLLKGGGRIGCLNFASAKNPGGGFLNGAVAQEESLALSSTLYAAQMAHFSFYEYNRSRKTYLYSDEMIYSPDVVVFRDERGELLPEPYLLDMLTSPAANVGAMRSNNPDELKEVEAVMLARMDKTLALFLRHGATRLLLGAWGCGVFRNDPAQMASWFARYLLPGGPYGNCFDEVLFAVYDRSTDGQNIRPFRERFEGAAKLNKL